MLFSLGLVRLDLDQQIYDQYSLVRSTNTYCTKVQNVLCDMLTCG